MIHDSARDNETPSAGLRIGALGWHHASWCADFYPDDLPEDWQLSFYANEFSTVLLPAQQWQQADIQADQLVDEVADNFSFYLQCPAQAESCAAAWAFGEQLGQQFAGIIAESALAEQHSDKVFCQATARTDCIDVWTPHNGASSGVGMLCLDDADIKTWRHWLEQFNQNSGGNLTALFVSDEDPSVQKMQQLKTLVELMGF